jgi:hypothetical protein
MTLRRVGIGPGFCRQKTTATRKGLCAQKM